MYKDHNIGKYKCKYCKEFMKRRFGFWLYCKICSYYYEIEGEEK